MIFLSGDLSRAEERVELMLGRDPRDIEQACSKPWEFDSYSQTAARIYGVPLAKVTKSPNGGQRYIGKRTTLAALRGLAGKRMSDELLKEGLVVTPNECDRWLRTYHAEHPAIEGTYFADVRKCVFRRRCLANSWGRTIWFTDERLQDELYRQAYSFLPQSEVADLINQWGFIPLWRWLRDNAAGLGGAAINAHVHDALLVSCRPADAFDIASRLRYTLERPRIYGGNAMTIPITFSVGATWAMSHEWKKMPDRDEMTEAALACERAQREAA